MITVGNVSHANSKSRQNFLSSNTDGELVSLGIANGMNVHHFSVDVDGRKIFRADSVSDVRFHSSQSYGGGEGNNGLTVDCEFDSLNIDIWDQKAPAAETRYWCILKIDLSQLALDRDEFIERWKKDEDEGEEETGDDLLTWEDEEDFIYERYSDRNGHQFLSLNRGRKRHARTILDVDTLRPDEDVISGEIVCTDWQARPREFSDDLLPLELRAGPNERVVKEISVDTEKVETGIQAFEFQLPDIMNRTASSWTISTQQEAWANYRAGITIL